MKKTITFFFLAFIITSNAQFRRGTFSKDPILNFENWDKQRVYFGFFLGFNAYDFKIDYKKLDPKTDVLVNSQIGFSVGLVADLRLNEYFNLRFEPGLYNCQRDLAYSNPLFTTNRDKNREVKSTYLNFPLLLKYSAVRTGNVRPFLLGGFSTNLNLGSNSNANDDNLQQVFRMKATTTNYELGFGVDLYLEYFKFSPSIRGVFSMDDELIRDADPNSPWTSNIEKLQTRGVFINFTFH
jgi:Outer membrane protein beta-barrel domain